ncbi:hypothetical protein [Arcanobacterium buesumense]|uniref:Uncharacterized protein n=1 Tax=Arcanobacterium buesumense TaxID=2722751 RepID=A0A6H2ENA5_9ACTO|nr:hypothetical protein [Arcanobacterium buesumense]QJC22557.1 hypothetical protein HC352_08620 [Arcanobacterium buesumense]
MDHPTKTKRRWWATVVAIAIILVGVLYAPAWRGQHINNAGSLTVGPAHKTVFVGFSGVTWADISAHNTPTLARLVNQGASANLVVKTLGVTTCPNAGWLTISQGVRAADPIADGCAQPVTASAQGILPATVETARIKAEEQSPFTPGTTTFGDELAQRGIRVGTVGSGAALALRSSANTALPGRHHINTEYHNGVATQARADYQQVADANLVLIDLGHVTNSHQSPRTKSKGMWDDLRAAFAPPAPRTPQARTQIAEIDTALGDLLATIDPQTTVIVASVADSDPRTARLQFFTILGPDVTPASVAYTNSTRHAGLVQLTDIPQALMTLLSHRPIEDFVGSAIAFSGHSYADGDTVVSVLQDNDARAIAVRPAVGPFYLLLSLCAGIFLIWWVAQYWWHARHGRSFYISRLPRFLGVTVAMLPAASFLANLLAWWNTPIPTVTFLACVIAWSVSVALLSMCLRDPATLVALITALTIGVDVIGGSVLHSSSVLGDQPQQGGRFYGLSNAPFTVFALSMIYLTYRAVLILRTHHERIALPAGVIALGASAIVLDGAGSLGADFGGVPALIAAFAVLFVTVIGRSLTARTMVTIVALALITGIGGAFIDWLRPEESWTHLGRFFQSMIDGEALGVIYRKLMAMIGSAPWFVWLIIAVVAIAVWLWHKHATHRFSPVIHIDNDQRWTIWAMITLVIVGIAINDSGLVILLMGVAYGGPLLAVCATTANGETMPSRR